MGMVSIAKEAISEMARETMRLGLAGYGAFGTFLIESWQALPNVEIVAIAGRNEMRLRTVSERYGIPKRYIGYGGLCTDPDVDVVAIATPPVSHSAIAIAATRAGKHVLCEPPLGLSVDQADGMIQAAAEAGVRLGVDHAMRYNPLVGTVKALIDQGRLGRLQRIVFENQASDEGRPLTHWLWDPKQSGGILVDQGVRMFDLYAYLISSPCSRAGSWTATRPGTDQEDRTFAIVEYENGVLATFSHTLSRPAWMARTWAELAFERGYLRMNGWLPHELELEAWVDDADHEALQALFASDLQVIEQYPVDQRPVRDGGQPYWVRQYVRLRHQLEVSGDALLRQCVQAVLQDFIAAVQNPSHRLRVTAEDARASLAVAQAARQHRVLPG